MGYAATCLNFGFLSSCFSCSIRGLITKDKMYDMQIVTVIGNTNTYICVPVSFRIVNNFFGTKVWETWPVGPPLKTHKNIMYVKEHVTAVYGNDWKYSHFLPSLPAFWTAFLHIGV